MTTTSSSGASQKDTVYVDIDDEITGIIEKVNDSDKKIVALVLPKRAGALQSIVNMRLLKLTADQSKKRIVLITSEAGLLPLAGAVGLHVAKTLQSKPLIPPPPKLGNAPVLVGEDETALDDADEIDASKPVGELAGFAPADTDDQDDTIEVDNDDAPEAAAPAAAAAAAKKPKKLLGKKLKIPNFEKFRLRLFLGIAALLLLIVGWYMAVFVLPKAKVTLRTDTSTNNADLTFTADPTAKELDSKEKIIPSTVNELRKTDSQKVPATGQKDLGTKATGSMTLTNCIDDADSHTVPAGTGFSSGQFTFVTDQAVTLPPSLYSGSNCKSADFGLSKKVTVTASQAGDKYNLGARAYTPPSSLVTSNGSVKASGSDMSGGTSKIVKIVAQSDVDGAKQKAVDQTASDAKKDITKELEHDGYIAITDTFANGQPLVTSSPNVGDEATDVTVNVTVTYTMLGSKEDDVKKFVETDAKKHIDASKQVITSNGLDKAVYKVLEKTANNGARINLQTTVVAGPQLDADTIKREVAGRKRGEALRRLQARPGIKDADIEYSPFWVMSSPKKTSKITVIFEQNKNAGR